MSAEMPKFHDGRFLFKLVNTATSEETDCDIDIIILEMTCRDEVLKHNLQTDQNGCYVYTPEFLVSLASRLDMLGVPGCTPSIALQLWVASGRQVEKLKKNTSEKPSSPSGSEETPPG